MLELYGGFFKRVATDTARDAGIVYTPTDYSVYTMRQASRRSWRIGQTEPVQVVFMAYRNTLQEATARLRAETGLKTPDALHAVAAVQVECELFVTNDADFRRVQGLDVTILDDLLPEQR